MCYNSNSNVMTYDDRYGENDFITTRRQTCFTILLMNHIITLHHTVLGHLTQ